MNFDGLWEMSSVAWWRMAGSLFIMLIAGFLIFYHRIIPGKERRALSIRIKIKRRNPRIYLVRIRNRSREPIDLEVPRIVLGKGKLQRVFRVNNQSAGGVFPLCLTPGSEYAFFVDTYVFCSKDQRLMNYSTAVILISGRNSKILKKKRVRWG